MFSTGTYPPPACHPSCFLIGQYRSLLMLCSELSKYGPCGEREKKAEDGMQTQITKHNRARGIIIHGPAHRGANGAAMPTDEDDQDGLSFFNHPERGGLLRCLGARNHCYCCLDPTPPTEGGRGARRAF